MAIDLTGTIGGPYDLLDYYSSLGDTAFPMGSMYSIFPYWRDQTKRGEAIPLYISEPELKYARDRSRVLVATNETAISALSSRRNYVVGPGFKYRALPAEENAGEKDKVVEKLQKFIDIWREYNAVAERESESIWRADEDGDAFVQLFGETSGDMAGMTTLRFIEPELVRSPSGDSYSANAFGVKCSPTDIETILGYYVVNDPIKYNLPELVGEKDVVHLKLNTRSTAKRGMPTLYSVESNLKRCEDLLASMTNMAKTRAKIAMIRKMKQTGKSAAQSFTDGLSEVSVTDPITGTIRNFEKLPYASILTTDAQKEYEFPHAQTDIGGFVGCLDAEYRAIASRLKMPEWMLSANSGNSSYSSTFVAESDSVKMFEFLQGYFAAKWGTGRFGNRKSILWRCIDTAVEVGVLPEEVYTECRIVVEPPSLTVRDKDREAATHKLYRDMNVISRSRVQQELGIDGHEEDKQIKDDEITPPVQDTLGGQEQGKTPIQRKRADAGNDPQVRSGAVRNANQGAEIAPDELEDDEMTKKMAERFEAIMAQMVAIAAGFQKIAAEARGPAGPPPLQPQFNVTWPSGSEERIAGAIVDGLKAVPAPIVNVAAAEVHIPTPPPAEHHHHIVTPVEVHSPAITVQPAAHSIVIPPHESPKSVHIVKNEDGTHTATKVD